MDVATLCRRTVVTAREGDDLTAAAKIMRDRHIGYVVVVEPGRSEASLKAIGVLTDRDIVVSVVARATDPQLLRVGEVMTRSPVVIRESASIDEALVAMRRIGVRRLPVVGNEGQLVGIIALDDIIDALSAELQNVAGTIRNEQRIDGALRS